MLSLEHIPCDLETKINILETGSFSKLAVTELQPLGFFLKVNAEDKKYTLKVNAKRKNT